MARVLPWWQEYYEGRPIHALPGTHEQALALLQRHLPAPARVLDLGGDQGAFALRLRDAGYDVTLADLHPPADLGIRTVSFDFDQPPDGMLDGDLYDAVVAVEVIEHLENPLRFLRMALGFTRSGGVLVVTTPNVVDIDSRARFLVGGDFWLFSKDVATRGAAQYSHIAILPYWLLRVLLQRAGWQPVERAFIGRKPRRGWQKLVVPALTAPLLALAWRIPRAATWTASTAFVCTKPSTPA